MLNEYPTMPLTISLASYSIVKEVRTELVGISVEASYIWRRLITFFKSDCKMGVCNIDTAKAFNFHFIPESLRPHQSNFT